MNKKSAIIAHRGLNRLAPENTISSFRLTKERGVSWIETDVDILGDGTAILLHDSTLERTTDRAGSIYDLSAADLDDIDAGGWFSPEYVGERIPTLRQLVDLANEVGLNMNIELKANEQGSERSVQLVETVIRELDRLDAGNEVIISSMSPALLSEYGRRSRKFPIANLLWSSRLTEDWFSQAEMCGATGVHPSDVGLTRDMVHAFRDHGLFVNPWTVNSLVHANELINWGCTGIITDTADTLAAARGALA